MLFRCLNILAVLAAGTELAAAQEPGSPPPAQPAAPSDAPVQAVTGRVIDALGKPIGGASVSVEGGTAAVKTARDGTFQISAAIGATLVIERAGYDPGLANVAGPKIDEIVLLNAGTNAETIEVSGEAPAAAPGAAVLDRSELQRIPGTGNDIVRALTAMPGVVNLQLPLGYSGVVIRGSSPQDSKVLVDGFEIPVLFHNIGFRALLPAESIQSLDYIPGGFDVQYGRASSGIISLETRAGSDRRTTQAEISAIDGGVLAQGNLGDKTRYMIGFRRSTIDLILPSIIPSDADLSLTTVPSYYDGQFRIDHELSPRWHLTLSSIGTNDVFELYQTKQDDADAKAKRFYNNTRFIRTTASAQYHEGPWQVKLALSGIAQQFIFESGLYQKIHASQPSVTPRIEVARTIGSVGGLTDTVLRFGGEAQVGRSTLDLALPLERREGEPPPPRDPKDVTTTFNGSFWIPDFAAWTSASANLDPRVRATLGARLDAFGRINEVAIEPRGEIQIKLPGSLTARLSAGAYRRPPEFQTENLYTNIGSEHSTQTIVGLQYEPREGIRVQTSGYYTDRTHLIERAADSTLNNVGRGTTVGAELLATYRGGPWFGWLSYSYSHSTRVDAPGDDSRLFDYDQPHSLNAALSWKAGRWQLGGRFQLYSGLPYTPAMGSVLDSDRNIYTPVYGAVNSLRAPIHTQLDVRVDYSWHWGPAEMTAFLDVQNVYMNESVVTYFYSYDYSQRQAFKSLPIIPSIGLRGVL
jgi:hypothetical protein